VYYFQRKKDNIPLHDVDKHCVIHTITTHIVLNRNTIIIIMKVSCRGNEELSDVQKDGAYKIQ